MRRALRDVMLQKDAESGVWRHALVCGPSGTDEIIGTVISAALADQWTGATLAATPLHPDLLHPEEQHHVWCQSTGGTVREALRICDELMGGPKPGRKLLVVTDAGSLFRHDSELEEQLLWIAQVGRSRGVTLLMADHIMPNIPVTVRMNTRFEAVVLPASLTELAFMHPRLVSVAGLPDRGVLIHDTTTQEFHVFTAHG